MKRQPVRRKWDLNIDAEFQALIFPAAAEEKRLLEESIKREGCRDPLVVARIGDKGILYACNVLLDGHSRHEICTRIGKGYLVETLNNGKLMTRDEAKAWIIRNQLGRRNLEVFQRAELVLKLESLIIGKAKERQRGGQGGILLSQNSVEAKPMDTQKELAKLSGLSHDTIHKAKVIAKKAPEDVKEKLRAGDTSVHAEYQKIKATTKPKPSIQSRALRNAPEHSERFTNMVLSLKGVAEEVLKFINVDSIDTAPDSAVESMEGSLATLNEFYMKIYRKRHPEARERRIGRDGDIRFQMDLRPARIRERFITNCEPVDDDFNPRGTSQSSSTESEHAGAVPGQEIRLSDNDNEQDLSENMGSENTCQ